MTTRLDKIQGTEKEAAGRRKVYRSPRLIRHGDLRDLTLGPTPGLGESGNPGSLLVH